MMDDRRNGPRLLVAGLAGAALVVLAAYGAHWSTMADEQAVKLFDTAWRIHAVHAAALLALALWQGCGRLLAAAFWLLAFGVVCFCGTLYATSLGGPHGLGFLAPVGGSTLIGGWLVIAAAGLARVIRPPRR